MGIVARQGIQYSVIGYLGFLLGTFSVIFIFPNDMEFYGKLRFIIPTAEMFLPMVVFGVSFSNVKYFRQARVAGQHQNFLSISLLFVVFAFFLFTAGYWLVNEIFPVLQKTQVWHMRKLIFPLIFIMAISAVLSKYISNYQRIAIPHIFQNLFPKIANLGAFILFFYLGFSEKISFLFFFSIFVLALVGYFVYLHKLEKFRWNFSLKYLKENQLWKSVLNYSFYGFLGNIGYYIAVRVDNFMIGELISFKENGVYSIIVAMLSFIMIPQMGIQNISAPIINEDLERGNFSHLDSFYKSTSLSLFFQGMVLFFCIVVGFPYLVTFIQNSNELRATTPILWILGSAMLFDLATGFNSHIISLSPYYRFNIVVMLILATLTVLLNFLFIQFTTLGITGVALSTALSLSLFNITKIIFIYRKFKLSPFSKKMLHALLLCGLSFCISYSLPETGHSLINLIYKPGLTFVLILLGNHFLSIIPLTKILGDKRK